MAGCHCAPAPFRIRELGPGDAALIHRFAAALSPETLQRRFGYSADLERLLAWVGELGAPGPPRHVVFGALHCESGDPLGLARAVLPRGGHPPEAAVTVGDGWQGRHVGTALLCALSDALRERGWAEMTAVVALDNPAALGLMRAVGGLPFGATDGGQLTLRAALGDASRARRRCGAARPRCAPGAR